MSKTWYPRWNRWPEIGWELDNDLKHTLTLIEEKQSWVKDEVQNILPINVEKLNKFLKWKD